VQFLYGHSTGLKPSAGGCWGWGLRLLAFAFAGLDGPGGQHTSEIRVIEVDAYASVADLIHAAIAANGGAATLKEIYEVCERNGRIAYRRADGSRLITTNDHWKSQVRHALYTGGRFERVPGNGEFWRLSQPYRGAAAELIKVLVRADDETADVRASVALPPSSGRALPEATATAGPQPLRSSGTGRQRRKRSAPPASGEIGAGNEATCDSVNHATSGVPLRTSARRQRTAATETGPPDNLSTLDEEDEVKELPRLRRGNRATPWRGNVNGTPFVDGAAHNYSFADEQRSSGLPHTSRDSEDPSTLRWGCTGLRSTYIIAAESSLSAGRTPAVPRTALARGRAGSAEADSAVPGFQHWLGKGHKAHDAADFSAPPAKRQVGERAYLCLFFHRPPSTTLINTSFNRSCGVTPRRLRSPPE